MNSKTENQCSLTKKSINETIQTKIQDKDKPPDGKYIQDRTKIQIMKQGKSQYAITQSAKEEDPDDFYKDDQKKDYNPIYSQKEDIANEIKNLTIGNVKDHGKYDSKEQYDLQTWYDKKQFQKYKEKNEITKNDKKYKKNNIKSKVQLSKQQLFLKNLQSRQDYQGFLKNEMDIKYHVLFLKQCNLDQPLYQKSKQQIQKGYFCTKSTGQDGPKILKHAKRTMYQLRIGGSQMRLIGHLFKFEQEGLNLIVFEKCENKHFLIEAINKLDKDKHVKDLKKQIYNEIKDVHDKTEKPHEQ